MLAIPNNTLYNIFSGATTKNNWILKIKYYKIGDMRMKENKVANFVKSLELPQYIANVLFVSWADCVEFMGKYHKRNALAIDDLLDYREHKISLSVLTEELFVNNCKEKGIKTAFEESFYQSFSEEDVSLIEKSLGNGKISLQSLFSQFKDNPNRNIMKYVL